MSVPCKWCSAPTDMAGTRCCDNCWHLQRAVHGDPEIALRMLHASDVEGLVRRLLSAMRDQGYVDDLDITDVVVDGRFDMVASVSAALGAPEPETIEVET